MSVAVSIPIKKEWKFPLELWAEMVVGLAGNNRYQFTRFVYIQMNLGGITG